MGWLGVYLMASCIFATATFINARRDKATRAQASVGAMVGFVFWPVGLATAGFIRLFCFLQRS